MNVLESSLKWLICIIILTIFSSCNQAQKSKVNGNTTESASSSYLRPIQWSFYEDNPVIRPGQLHGEYESTRVSCCSVLNLGEKFRMYYWTEDSKGHYYIAQAERPIDRVGQWQAKGIILERQPDKPHNSQGPCYAQVIPQDDGPWLMYVCTWGTARPNGKLPYATNLVISQDEGKTWQYHGDEPVFPHSRWWNKEGTGSVCVIKNQGKFRAYFTSFAEYKKPPAGAETFHGAFSEVIPSVGIGYAESEDGINWTYPLDHRVVEPRGFIKQGYEYLLSKPWVIKDGDGYRMWCGAMGTRYRIRSLTSKDGINWEFQDDWIFADKSQDNPTGIGSLGSFDDIQRSYPSVIKIDDKYYFWYTGNWFGQTGDGYKTGMGFAIGELAD